MERNERRARFPVKIVKQRVVRAIASLPGIRLLAVMLLGLTFQSAIAAEEYLLSPGDNIRVSVFKSPDLTLDARVSETGAIGFPLIGSVQIGGLTIPAAEKKIGQALRDGNFVLNPQVTIMVTLAVGNQVAVLGQVNKPGRYPVQESGGHLTGLLATAGGIAPTGGDVVIITGSRGGKPFRREVDMLKMSLSGTPTDDIELAGGDTLYVNRAPQFYIYGQVQRPGGYRLDKGMTVMQALATGGGVTGKGTSRGIVLHRRDAAGKVNEKSATLDEDVQDQDVIYVKESVF